MKLKRLSEKNAKLWLCVTSAMGSDGTKITSLMKFTQNCTFPTTMNKRRFSTAAQRRVPVYLRSWNISMKEFLMKWENSLKWKESKGGKDFRNWSKRWNRKSRKSIEKLTRPMLRAKKRTIKNLTEKKPKTRHPQAISKKIQSINQPDLQLSKRSASRTGNKTSEILTPTPNRISNSTMKTMKIISSDQSKLSQQTVVESMLRIWEWSTQSRSVSLANLMWENPPWSMSF